MKKTTIVFMIISLLTIASNANAQIVLNEEHQKQMAMTNLSSMPLAFTENKGQFGEKTLFKANAGGATFYFYPDEVAYLFVRDTDELLEDDAPGRPDMRGMPDEMNQPRYKKESMLIKAQFVGANPNPEVIGAGRLPHNNNYFYGNDPSKWRTDVPNYSAIIYKDIYPGIDLKYYGNGSSMKYDFIVNPSADMSQIAIRYEGVDEISISNDGDLQLNTAFGFVYENKPYVYQLINGRKVELGAEYYLKEQGLFGFDISGYNPNYPIIIDPALIYSTYLGGTSEEWGQAISLDGSGNAYVTGYTNSSDFPTVNPYDGSLDGYYDVFVTKLLASGNSLAYSTYLGGNGNDYGFGIAVDGSGNAYVTGYTGSSDFPTVNPYDGSFNGSEDVFVTKLSASGNSLVYSTYLGGSTLDRGLGVTVDGSENAYVTGNTLSSDFPTVNPYNGSLDGYYDVFVSKLSAAGGSLIYSTYLGGSNADFGQAIAVDGSGNAFVTGYTYSSDFPTVSPYDGSLDGSVDIFITKFSTAGNSLDYSTYLGGSNFDGGKSIAVDGQGNAYVTGNTLSSDFPTVNPYDGSFNGPGGDVFVTKLSVAGSFLAYSTYLGGGGQEGGHGIALDGSGNAYVTGWTSSSDFPTVNPYDGSFNGGIDVFVSNLTTVGDSLVYSTFLGGYSNDLGNGIAVDGSRNAYVTGYTWSLDFPTVNPYQTNQPDYDAFIAKFGPGGPGGCGYTVGDVNASDSYNGLDVTYGVSFLKGGNPPMCEPCPLCPDFHYCGDVNGSCSYNGLDITYGVAYLKGGDAPVPCPDCPPPN